MGYICDIYEFDRIKGNSTSFTVFSCLSLDFIRDKFKDYRYISLGELLSAELMKSEKEKRSSMIESELEKLLTTNGSNEIIISDIDILFNPEYRLDVIKSFVNLSRNKNLIIQWPGEYHGGNLIYSKQEYSDYKRYLIKDYDAICLK